MTDIKYENIDSKGSTPQMSTLQQYKFPKKLL